MDPGNPLTMLVPLVGIALILLAVWLTGGARRARLDRALVLRRLDEDAPDFVAEDVVVDAGGGTALAAAADRGAVALVFAAGDRVAVRKLAPGDVRRLAQESGPEGVRLVIDTGDFTHGRFDLLLPKAEAERWAARLAPGTRAA